MKSTEITKSLAQHPLVAVLVVEQVEDTIPLLKTLQESGVKFIELTLRTPAALEALRVAVANFPDLIIGAGTVLFPAQVEQVKQAGAHFAVAPGCNEAVLRKAQELDFPFYPGVMTPSDIELALQYDVRVMKFFHASAAGGLPYLKSIVAPYQHLDLKFIPLGGVKESTLADFIKDDLVIGVGGSWLATAAEIKAQEWDVILTKAKTAVAIAERK